MKMSVDTYNKIKNEGKEAFNNGTSENPYKESSQKADAFLIGWLAAKEYFYNNNEQKMP